MLAVTAWLAAPALAAAAPGDLDPTYGTGGTVAIAGPAATGLALAPDDTAVVAGASEATPYPSVQHVRVTAAGRPGSVVRREFGYYQYASVGAAAVDAAGRAVIAGGVRHPDWGAYPTHYFLRYLPDGRPDPSFGDGGTLILDLTDENTVEEVIDVAVDHQGRTVFLAEITRRPVVGWLTPDGRFDHGPVDLGRATGLEVDAAAITVLPDGDVLVAGGHRGTPIVIRIGAGGALVPGYGNGGVARIEEGTFGDLAGDSIALAPGGGAVLAGRSLPYREAEDRFWAIRLTPDGRVDPSFGGPLGTSVKIPIPPRQPGTSHLAAGARDVAVQANGKVVLAGEFTQNGEGSVEKHGAVVRLLADGTPDGGFGGDGIVVVPDGWYGFGDVALQRDGRIVLSRPYSFDLTRLEGDGPTGAPYEPAAVSPAVGDAAPGKARRRARIVVGRRGRATFAVPCRARRCRVRLRVGRAIVASKRVSGRRRVTLRLNRRALRRLDRHGELAARLEIRTGKRRLVRQVVLSQRAT